LPADGTRPTPRQVAVVFNPASGASGRGGAAERRRAIQAVLAAHGARTIWYETSREDPGHASAQLAVAQGVDLLLVSGGDGSVMACARALVRTAIPLGIVPSGTGNIVAASLRLPTGVVEAIEVAVHGGRQWIDIGASGPGSMLFAGSIGFGAAVMRDATPALKARTGMVAYMLSAARHLLDSSGTFRVRIDNQALTVQKSDGVLVGNFGQLMTKPRLPRTALDDGLLEVGILRIRPLLDWLRQDRPALRPPRRPPLDWYQARRVEVDCDRSLSTERDGDWVGLSSHLSVHVLPRSLLVCVPGSGGLSTPMRPLLHWVARDVRKLLPRPSGDPLRAKTETAPCTMKY
jgi:diacylglycerol kinase family enzyme